MRVAKHRHTEPAIRHLVLRSVLYCMSCAVALRAGYPGKSCAVLGFTSCSMGLLTTPHSELSIVTHLGGGLGGGGGGGSEGRRRGEK